MRVRVKVNAGSKTEGVRLLEEGLFQVRTRAPAEDGRANRRVLQLLSEHFDIDADRVRIVAGAGKTLKVVEIDALAGGDGSPTSVAGARRVTS